jgi:hypothetical protein
MQKSALLAALRTELHRHDFSTFVYGEKTVAQGGNGVVVPGCPKCKKRFGTMPQFLDHLTDDVLPALLDRLSEEKVGGAGCPSWPQRA